MLVNPIPSIATTDVALVVAPVLVPPLPNLPSLLAPQQYAEKSAKTVHECLAPTETSTAAIPTGRELTLEGEFLLVVVPSPNCPLSLSPQQ